MSTSDLLTVTEAAALLGVTRQTLHARLRDRPIERFIDGSDHRVVLLRRADIEALAQMRPGDSRAATRKYRPLVATPAG